MTPSLAGYNSLMSWPFPQYLSQFYLVGVKFVGGEQAGSLSGLLSQAVKDMTGTELEVHLRSLTDEHPETCRDEKLFYLGSQI